MINKFNLLTKQYTNYTETKLQNEEKIQDSTYNKKRKFNELNESSNISKPIQILSTHSISNLKLKPIDTISQHTYDKKEQIQKSTSSDAIKVKSLEILEKYLYQDERLIENDKNIGSTYSQSKTP
jgi:hypothetical protein